MRKITAKKRLMDCIVPTLNSFLLYLLYTKHLVVKYINVKIKADRK